MAAGHGMPVAEFNKLMEDAGTVNDFVNWADAHYEKAKKAREAEKRLKHEVENSHSLLTWKQKEDIAIRMQVGSKSQGKGGAMVEETYTDMVNLQEMVMKMANEAKRLLVVGQINEIIRVSPKGGQCEAPVFSEEQMKHLFAFVAGCNNLSTQEVQGMWRATQDRDENMDQAARNVRGAHGAYRHGVAVHESKGNMTGEESSTEELKAAPSVKDKKTESSDAQMQDAQQPGNEGCSSHGRPSKSPKHCGKDESCGEEHDLGKTAAQAAYVCTSPSSSKAPQDACSDKDTDVDPQMEEANQSRKEDDRSTKDAAESDATSATVRRRSDRKRFRGEEAEQDMMVFKKERAVVPGDHHGHESTGMKTKDVVPKQGHMPQSPAQKHKPDHGARVGRAFDDIPGAKNISSGSKAAPKDFSGSSSGQCSDDEGVDASMERKRSELKDYDGSMPSESDELNQSMPTSIDLLKVRKKVCLCVCVCMYVCMYLCMYV
jgi:hypothetical protein